MYMLSPRAMKEIYCRCGRMLHYIPTSVHLYHIRPYAEVTNTLFSLLALALHAVHLYLIDRTSSMSASLAGSGIARAKSGKLSERRKVVERTLNVVRPTCDNKRHTGGARPAIAYVKGLLGTQTLLNLPPSQQLLLDICTSSVLLFIVLTFTHVS